MESHALESGRPSQVAHPYKPNFLLAWLYRVFFHRIDVDPTWVRAVRDGAARGTVVYVMRSVSWLDFVAIDFFLKKFSLPLIRFVTSLRMWILEPTGSLVRRLFVRREPDGPALERAIGEGHSALLFMRRPRDPTALKVLHGDRADTDHLRILVQMQRRQSKPILLMPQVIVFGKQPDALRKGALDQVFGPPEYPGRLRMFGQLVWHYGNVKLRACEPLDLRALVDENPALSDDELVQKIAWTLSTRLDRERRVVLGPMAKGPDRLKQEILRNPRIREAIEDTARRESKRVEVIEAQARADLDRLGAKPDAVVLTWVDRACLYVFSRIYQGIELDLEGLERVREQARKGPIVLLPSHKSHLDYVLLSYQFFEHGLQCPLIAAGDNLAFWPAGPLLRRCGAFFIRRSFRGARLYTLLVDAYVRKILKEGYAIEFFIEGGRSRTGKLLSPKIGLMSMVAEAADGAGIDVAYVPISVGYERVVEQRAYLDELTGGEKQKEDAGALLRTTRILQSRYGRAYVQFGEILHLGADPARRAAVPVPEAADEGARSRAAKRAALDRAQARRTQVQALGQRVLYEINRVTPVTPTSLVATVLLGESRRGVERDALLARATALVSDLQAANARFASSLAVGAGAAFRVDAVDEAINLFAQAGQLRVHGPADQAVYQVPDDRRLALDFYKNNLIHFFVPRALVATAIGPTPDGISRGRLRAHVEELATLLRHEFHFRAGIDAEFDDTLAGMVARGDLSIDGGEGDEARVRAPDESATARLRFLAGLIANFLESYRIAARVLHVLRSGPLATKDLVKRAFVEGERMFVTGEVLRREAVSRPNLENAFDALHDLGYLLGGEQAPRKLASSAEADGALEAIELRFARWLA